MPTTRNTKSKNVLNYMKEMPNSTPLEKKCISQMMNDCDNAFSYRGLCSDIFYDETNRTIYNIMEVLWKMDKKIDSANIFSMLSDDERKKISISMLNEIESKYKDTSDIQSTIEMLDEMKARRDKIEELSNAINSLFDSSVNPQVAVSNITNTIELVAKAGDTVKSMKEVNESADALLMERFNRGNSIAGMESGIEDLDKAINGFSKKELILIAGRPSMGKTLVAGSIMDGLSRRGHKGLFFSLEQSAEEIRDKIIANSANIPHDHITGGKLYQDEWARHSDMVEFMNDYEKYPLRIDDNPRANITHIKKTCEREKRKHGLDYVVIDYLTYIPQDDIKAESDVLRIKEIVKELKNISKELDVNVILLAQLNRQCETRDNKRPQMSDLRGSGSIEEEADKLLFLYRNHKYSNEESEINDLEINVAKFRGGPTGTVMLKIELEYQRVSSWNDTKK